VAAHHIELDERVAIKLLLPEMLQQPEAVARFTREARAAVKIKSEHVARILDVGSLENGAPFIVMEYLDGSDLAAWLRNSGPLSPEQAVEFLLQAGEAVAEAHALGIVHRDLKPANLFVVRRADGLLSVKVLDFGISKVTDASMAAGAATSTLALMGSPLYMSPEQMESARTADARSDIWSLGVILYELLTGACPFNGETIPELVLQVAWGTPVPLRNKRPDAPDGLETVLIRCLEKSPAQRYQTVAELATALADFAPKRARISVDRISGTLMSAGLLSVSPSGAPDSGQTPIGQPGGPSETASSFGTTAARKRPQKIAIGLAVLGVVALAIGGVLLTRLLRVEAAASAAASVTSVAVAPSANSTVTPSAPPPTLASPPATEAFGPRPESPPADARPVGPTGVATPKPRPVRLPAQAPKPSATKATSANCTPNFYFDSQGEKHFKAECF